MNERDFVIIKVPDLQWRPQFIFGHLVRLAWSTVKAYHCDLYHDAVKIGETFNITNEYFFYVGECGTYLLTKHNPMYGHHGRPFWFKIVREGS